MEAPSQPNPIVFMDVAIGGQDVGRMKFELFADTVPRTAENFRQFCTGEFRPKSIPVGYKNARFHRIIKDFMIQGGDFISHDGKGSLSIYGENFNDENFIHKHTGPGLLSMANSGTNTNGCQFFVTCAPAPFLDDKHVVFGKLIDGWVVMRKIENVPTDPGNRPKLNVIITQCGEM
ncbi:peptidyl-prolyl cis-trans isomerase H [Capsaspora owczarzaki ATCC 30864]|uniref:Peptidyl-prolyl cis-trans isomerase n=1 Tax=Capsaspora owczarzaki (strain ATCC 30864) TaxID=595528 RepID=A0A0D2VQC6_CAPO3|nr:peptidyl-prolyl cis-trans isomerase H [Capsaspora owczarzaki ATCC 30864]KJE92842.1 peptidyl-prolyl cis-trans isomerase H [Capsaspora owczarzaki ATCC 30864]|eukprot:XP_004363466.1 peptidyl-prolyl cis-trans isomerase H [Capsaspora owczarzaki ATCC 30864]